MATLILRDTYLLLEEEIKSIDKLRTETALKIKEAASHGDLKENYEYKAAKEKMELVVYKKQLLQSYAPFRFIESNEIETNQVEFGNKVTPLIQKNVPTQPSKWAYYKAQAKKKFDVYPSAYANGWAAKKYKAAGGGWKKG